MLLIIYLLVLVGFAESRQYEIFLNEEAPINTIIYDLNNLSPSQITYQLLESSSLLHFNSTTNLISISKRIDRDVLCPYDEQCTKCSLTMKLYNMSSYDILILKFKINDINDNQPTFSSNTYSISLTENNIPGMKIHLSKAEDIDCLLNGVHYYELTYMFNNRIVISSINLHETKNQTTQFNDQPFYLNYDLNSDLYLIINISLDRELRDEYVFTLTVNDYKHTTSTKINLIVLDVNDHNPKFPQSIYSFNISISVPIGTILLKLTAYDEDSHDNARIYYSLLSIDGHKIESNEKNDLFYLNSYTGELSLKSKLNQVDSKNIFKLIIGASDGTHNAIPALATVYINIVNDLHNDNKSLIQITFGSNRVSKNHTEVYISENLPNATFIAYVKSDENIQVIYDGGFFMQKLAENSFTLLTNQIYDREKRSSFKVILHNKHVQRSFKIIVTDVNDCKPMWNTEVLNIDVDNYVHSNDPIIEQLNASDCDENSKVAYRKKNKSWPYFASLLSNQLIINCSAQLNETNNDCWFKVSNGEVHFDVEAYDVDNENFSSVMKIRLYRRSMVDDDELKTYMPSSRYDFFELFNHDYILRSIAILMGLLFVIAAILICIYCRRESIKRPASLITDDHSTKQKIIQTSSSEQTSSAGSLYGSEKSDNITVETSDMFLFSPKRAALIPHPADNLTNKLFHSIQTDLSVLTEKNPPIITTRGTYV
ncbi:unnamed protein product [Rotaria socialis]|nr:unnamed protein product [Rotaria socialis]